MAEDIYYALPLRLDAIVDKRQAARCSLKDSIAQHIHLLLTSHFHENRFDSSYGCGIWEQDFELMTGLQWKDQTRDYIKKSIETHERRLVKINVKVELSEQEIGTKENKRIKRRVTVFVEGFTRKTNEKFTYQDQIFIAPLSVD
ncbi:MAG: GPW/gp25 family protein [Bernardetiaceae bacterium]|jgi:phage baseplate assembly protein W|nr:GPW/gp25 family protein [Bernardetiaceae bacterium]